MKSANSRFILVGFIVPLLALMASAQGRRADFERAASLRGRWEPLLRRFPRTIEWMPHGDGVFWDERAADGRRRWVVVGVDGQRTHGADPKPLGIPTGPIALAARSTWKASGASDQETSILFENRLDQPLRLFWVTTGGELRPYGELPAGESRTQHTFAGHVWVLDFAANDLAGIFVAAPRPGHAIIDETSRAAAMSSSSAEPARPRLTIKDGNIFVLDASGPAVALTRDGTPEDPYGLPTWWSPDGRRVLGMRSEKDEPRRIPLIESSPRDGVQPRLHWQRYRKPGDPLPFRRPRLFDIEERRQIPIDESVWRNAWSVDRVHWSSDGRLVHCLFNRRGHQELVLRAIDAETGAVTDLIRETSPTFVDYSQKTWLHWLDDTNEVLWASERDGWNHLYRFDSRTGEPLGRITKGPWVVRRVERVDEQKRQIWFVAMGIHPDQDPYHQHLARVDFDGQNLVVLTQGDGTHDWTFSPGHELFIDRWSRVDHPTVIELRRSRDGALVAELGRDDVEALEAAGFRAPQRFVAKGRDGETDIHGIIIRPSNWQPKGRYPVIEFIYAGPHGHHVPKAWAWLWRQRELAELGFVVVQIDGMGTNWRSKAFHDHCWQNLKDAGFPDRIAWMRAANAAHPELDLGRVGITGGSAGGQNALAALLHHGDFYRAAAADCGCHDNRMDKIWWNEAWMGTLGPHYAENSNVTHAHRLQGDLFLSVGELDRNVDPASTMQVVDALTRADKDFELVVVPGGGHGVGGSPYVRRRRTDFFVRKLLGVEPERGLR
ncbi:MAG: prolyl oligopeptidase family serine peptidase [Planctomycetes bacterium]|nr:prolyl oligopeptidase family serine peptidase [Planctomycetota bacterium]